MKYTCNNTTVYLKKLLVLFGLRIFIPRIFEIKQTIFSPSFNTRNY